jgi:arylsulfatase A-like enzyme
MAEKQPITRPSILFLNIDDWNDWNSVLKGHPQAITPNLKLFAARSVTFTRAICASPVCFPSRTALFSGLHPSQTGALSNSNGGKSWRSYVPKAITIPKHLSNQGWKSIGIGKNFHRRDQAEFNQYFTQNQKVKAVKNSLIRLNPSATWGIAAVPVSKMPDYLTVSQGIKTLKSTSDSLFLSLGIYRPHVPWIVPKKYFDMYPLTTLLMPEKRPNDLDDLPSRFKLLAHNEAKFGPGYHQKLVTAGHDKNKVRAYLASLTFADEQIGRILDAWYASPHADNGYVVLWSDHGYQLSEKEGWSKMKPWFDSARVNLMIAGPGLANGEVCNKAVSLIDLYPTLVELLKLPKPPQNLYGKSILPLLQKPQTKWDKPVLMSSEIDGIRYDVVMDNDYRMTRLVTGETELYKLTDDPHEFSNLAANPEYNNIIAKLSRHLSFRHPKIKKDGWLEAEETPCQTSADFGQRGNYHYPKLLAGSSKGKVVCVNLIKGIGSYIDFVVNIENPGDYQLKVAINAQGACSLSTSAVVDDAKQADASYPMNTLLRIAKSSSNGFQALSAGTVTFKRKGLYILRFKSEVKSQLLQIDRIQLKKI